ncbi:hypothetical protein AB4672_06795 [Bacillus paralicheniformis]|uniref:hypothetical protein n=1 Tax=Bacillus paralicheniformis TaxID=1648923 RepID=UPI0011A9908A|nr:hypothetical protein [Bacillus paralicheniformis]TWJ34594.1 hypothetical protein CHCC5027_0155 [Bacillus paralicheniformis]
MKTFDLLLKGASVVCPEGVRKTDIGVKNGMIAVLGVHDVVRPKIFSGRRSIHICGNRRFSVSRAGRNERRSPLPDGLASEIVKGRSRSAVTPILRSSA